MRSCTLLAPAKVNLHLEILGLRADGYHELVMILQCLELSDRIHLKPNDTIRVYCEHSQVPVDQSNLAYRAAALMGQTFGRGGVEINIEKNIPVAAGLAGGSSNAAAVIVGLNLLWDLGLTQPQLQELGAKIGSDVPFCVAGGTAIATGRGEILDPIQTPNDIHVVLAKYQSLAVSTPWAYQTYRQQYEQSYGDPASWPAKTRQFLSASLVQAIAQGNYQAIGQAMHNDLEKVVFPAYPQVAHLRQLMGKYAPAMMSGSGPTIFALCASPTQAEAISQEIRTQIPDPDLGIWVSQFSTGGIRASLNPG